MSGQNQNKENENKNNRKKWLIPLLILLLLLLIAGGVFAGIKIAESRQTSDSGASDGGVGLSIDESAGEKKESQDESAEEAPGVAIPGWGSITIPAGETEITSVDLYNPVANEDYYYLTFELRILDNSLKGYEVLYSSQLVPPGQHLQKITLSRPLEEGKYEAVIHVQPYKMDEAQTPTNNADMETTLIVQ